MNREDLHEELIDLGEASLETKGAIGTGAEVGNRFPSLSEISDD